ncbi:MAG TPA: hypothetical protein VGR35_08740 [Tepidisphaeraceae bacterium]|nr:hypothetical protein [Tepidisphaeraceae bacterium]
MRIAGLILLVLFLVADAFAQAGREQERAATAAAVRGLMEAAAKEHIAPGVTVGKLLDQTKGHERLRKELSRAQMIGGTRWVGNTAQVRLEISGSRVAQALVNIAASEPKKSPIPADVLAVKLKDWNQRTFSATGSSTGAAEIEHARPGGEAPAWAAISDDARRAAVAAAKENAVNSALDSVRDVKLPNGKTAGEALKDPAVREKLRTWLSTRPVTEVQFRDDLNVAVQLSAPPAEFFEAFRDALRFGEPDAAAWEAVREEFQRRLASPFGTAAVGAAAGVPTKPTLQLPALPPPWTNRQIESEGAATAAGSKLKCARMAEARAAEGLVTQLEALPLTENLTVGQAAERDPRIREALDRAASRGRTYKVEYDSDGGAHVWVQLDLHHVWEELRGVR